MIRAMLTRCALQIQRLLRAIPTGYQLRVLAHLLGIALRQGHEHDILLFLGHGAGCLRAW